jgi:hypothetical protein
LRRFSVALAHHPVLDRQSAVVTTAITNIDLHDIARSARCFGAERFFVTHPVAAQRQLAERVKEHWTEGSGARRIPDRKPAMENLHVVPDLDTAMRVLGSEVQLWTSSAGKLPIPRLPLAEARDLLRGEGPPVLLVLGTGWGLADAVHERASYCLAPIESPSADGYNHLSVRAAAAILLDRLLGVR